MRFTHCLRLISPLRTDQGHSSPLRFIRMANWRRNLLLFKWQTNCARICYLFLSNYLFIQQLIVAEWEGRSCEWSVPVCLEETAIVRPWNEWAEEHLGRFKDKFLWPNLFGDFSHSFYALLLLLPNTTIDIECAFLWSSEVLLLSDTLSEKINRQMGELNFTSAALDQPLLFAKESLSAK